MHLWDSHAPFNWKRKNDKLRGIWNLDDYPMKPSNFVLARVPLPLSIAET